MRRSRLLWILPLLPAILFWFGALLNLIAITSNHGVMPYLDNWGWRDYPGPGIVTDHAHITWNAHVHVAILCDWIQWFDGSVWSIGDCFLELGKMLDRPLWFAWLLYVIFHREE